MNKKISIFIVAFAVVCGGVVWKLQKRGVEIAPVMQESTRAEIAYENKEYGFRFVLPESWKGYSVVRDAWNGSVAGDQGEKIVERGPIILIRHPLWTQAVPRQDIPIMVFTRAQWDALARDAFHIGAAPIGPSELGRNEIYVFALPARYNYAFPPGYEEVESIMHGDPLHAF